MKKKMFLMEVANKSKKKKPAKDEMKRVRKKNLSNKQLNIFPLKYIGHRISKDNFLKAYFSCELSN
jgi:hypothetical protein